MAKIIGKLDKLLLIIIALAFLVRLIGLGSRVIGFTGDEAAFGYDAYSILKQGTDEFGKKFPLYFQSIGDYKYPAYVYLSTIFVGIFGLTEFSTRLLSVFSGVTCVFVIYYLVYVYSKNRWLSLTSSFFLAISPLSIFFSRGAFESNLGLAFALSAIYFFKKFFVKIDKKYLIWCFIFFILSIFSYSAYRIFLPLIFVFMFLIEQKKKSALLFVVLSFLAVLLSFIPRESRARVNSLTGSSNNLINVNQTVLIYEDGLSNPGFTLPTRIFHNKIVITFQNYLASYINQLNPDLWFVNGDKTRVFYNIPDMGLLYLVDAPFIAIGFIYLFNKQRKLFWLTLGVVGVGILPSSLANELPSSVRLLPALPGLIVLSASGAYAILSAKRFQFKKLLCLSICIFFAFNILYFFHQYLSHFGYDQPYFRDYGMDTLVTKTTSLVSKYDAVVMPNDPYIFFLFFNKVLPSEFLKTANLGSGGPGTWERVDSFGKFIFKMNYGCPKVGRLNVLYVCTGSEVPKNAKVIDVLRYVDKLPEYILIDFYPLSKIPDPLPKLPSELKYMVDVDKRNDGLILNSENRYW